MFYYTERLYIMAQKIKYTPLDEDSLKILQLVKSQRFRNPEAFIDRAIQILLTWELDPRSSLDIMKGYPQTEEQKEILKALLQPEVYQNNFPIEATVQDIDEEKRIKAKNESKDDYSKLIENLTKTKEYIKGLKIAKEEKSIIGYDHYPILFRFYSRFAPAKIVLCVLADLLRQNPSTNKINLKILRADALDIASELANKIIEFEEVNSIKRTRKVSTGFPKIKNSIEENIPVQKRFRDQYVGKIRRDRKDKKHYFDGILSALGLATVTKEGKETYISMTEIGKEFYLLDNPILDGDYVQGLSKDEADFIIEKIIPKLKLEKLFYDTALDVIQKYYSDPLLQQEPITRIVDQEIVRTYNQYVEKNSEESIRFGFTPIEYKLDVKTGQKTLDKISEKYIEGWRVATMSRLVELKRIEWNIDSDGQSVFTIFGKE
jgi:hypothetical protein